VTTLEAAALKGVTIFSTLQHEQLSRVVESGEVVEHPAGATLTEEGAIGHRFYLILAGTVQVERGGRTVDTLGRGEFVGEIGLLGGGPSTATVRCTSPTSTLTIWRERFWELLESQPTIALRILEVLCRRLEHDRAASPSGNLLD
jgi:CRP/FNR family transcriptional regulator, cyclic AMP receptor protein